MARRANPGAAAGAAEAADHEHEATPLAGGAPGILEDAVTEVGGASAKPVASAHRPPREDAPEVPVKRYEVYGCGPHGKPALLNGYKCVFRDGKVIEDKDYDLEALYAQGISFREIGK